MLQKLQHLSFIHLLFSLLLMAVTPFFSPSADDGHRRHHHHRNEKQQQQQHNHNHQQLSVLSSWEHFKTLLSCKTSTDTQARDHSNSSSSTSSSSSSSAAVRKNSKFRSCRAPSICDVVHVSTRVFHRPEGANAGPLSCSSDAGECYPLRIRRRLPESAAVKSGGVPLMRFSGCYECRAVETEPASRRYPRPRTLCVCPQCGEVFTKTDSLELHQTTRHAVSELGPEDSGRHIVEIIFKSSWQKKDRPICKIDRILKVHNTARTVARFEDYRAAVKTAAALQHPFGAAARNPRCAADGNELLRFHAASLSCKLGAAGSNSLCSAASASAASAAAGAACGVCAIIRHGFRRPYHPLGVRTTASSGRAHDHFSPPASGGGDGRAMLVCRVISGRVRIADDADGGGYGYDSVTADGTNLEELFVVNPRAILPCFVVIYRAQD